MSLIFIISHLFVEYIDIGARVECKLAPNDDKWFAGTVLQRDTNWSRSPLETPPYRIRFDYGVSVILSLYVGFVLATISHVLSLRFSSKYN